MAAKDDKILLVTGLGKFMSWNHTQMNVRIECFGITNVISGHKIWYPLDRNGIVKSCDSSRFWLIIERLITFEYENRTEIGSDLQPKRFLS